MRLTHAFGMVLALTLTAMAVPPKKPSSPVAKPGTVKATPGKPMALDTTGSREIGYRIDEPGTITFTVGVKIVGKVEKPEVVIFLPKEKPTYRPVTFTHSFAQDIAKPLSFVPVTAP